jgi:hypothetical protein
MGYMFEGGDENIMEGALGDMRSYGEGEMEVQVY